MLRLFLKLLLFLPIVVLIVGANYFVDPANLYHSKVPHAREGETTEQTFARYLSSGYNVANVETLDERLLQKYFITSMPRDPLQMVVLGSSRSQLIGNNIFPGIRIINNSVTGATVEDIFAILDLYDSMNFKPDTIAIELSPWYLNDNNAQTRWKVLQSNYERFETKLRKGTSVDSSGVAWSGNRTIDPKIKELFNFEYFQQSMVAAFTVEKLEEGEGLFTSSEFSNGYSLSDFFTQLLVLSDTLQETRVQDTLSFINDYIRKPDLFGIIKKAYPEQEFPEEIISLQLEVQQEEKNRDESRSGINQLNLLKLNRKLLEVVFYETCPPLESQSAFPTHRKENRGLTRVADGTVCYPDEFRHQTVEQVNYSVQSFLSTPVFGLGDFREISQTKLAALELAIDYLKEKGIGVKLILVPYHPTVFNVLTTDSQYRKAIEAETIFRNLARQKNLDIVGSYNPANCNLTNADFYDAMHPKESAMKEVLFTHTVQF